MYSREDDEWDIDGTVLVVIGFTFQAKEETTDGAVNARQQTERRARALGLRRFIADISFSWFRWCGLVVDNSIV